MTAKKAPRRAEAPQKIALTAAEIDALPKALGLRGFCCDAPEVNFGAVVKGGGSHIVPVWCDGTTWYVG